MKALLWPRGWFLCVALAGLIAPAARGEADETCPDDQFVVPVTQVSTSEYREGRFPRHRGWGSGGDRYYDETILSEPIADGYVIWEGRYLPPPYKVERFEDQVHLNGLAMPALVASATPRPSHFRGGPYGERSDPTNPAVQIGRILERGGLLIVETSATHWIRSDYATLILETLVSDESPKDKLESLQELDPTENDNAQGVDWASLANNFVADEATKQQFAVTPVAHFESANKQVGMSARTVRYGMTVGGMCLGVFAFGMLLQHRPHVRGLRGEVDVLGDGYQMLPMYVLLFALFALFDLGCTIFASQSGGLLELNPLGSSMLQSPLALAVVKIFSTLGSAGILLMLRKHRFAQVASWWVCLFCTFLTLRWVTFNSMFLA